MALPKAAQAQIKAAEKLHAEVYSTDEEEKPKVEDTPQPDEEKEGLREVPPAEGSVEASPAPVDTPPKDDDFEHKYNVLQGKYSAEVPRLTEQNEALQGQLAELRTQMAQMQEQMAQPAETIEPGSHLNEEEIEDYGADMISVVKRAAREEFEPELARLQQENQQLRGLLGGMQQQTAMTARDHMLEELDRTQSNWRQLNQDPTFLGWLEGIDPFSGQKKLDLLRQAFESNNTARVLAFFKGFLNEDAVTTSHQTPSAAAEPQVNLETLVAPGRAAESGDVSAQTDAPQGRVWKDAEIKQFYADVNRGVYRNDPDEKARIERDIFLAQREGRIAF